MPRRENVFFPDDAPRAKVMPTQVFLKSNRRHPIRNIIGHATVFMLRHSQSVCNHSIIVGCQIRETIKSVYRLCRSSPPRLLALCTRTDFSLTTKFPHQFHFLAYHFFFEPSCRADLKQNWVNQDQYRVRSSNFVFVSEAIAKVTN